MFFYIAGMFGRDKVEPVKLEFGDGFLLVTIQRPEVRNAISYEVMDGLLRAIKMVDQDPKYKVLAITGAGEQAFCSGGDLKEFHSLTNKEGAYKMLSKMGNVLWKLTTLSKPVFAFLNGTAVGGGMELATACDFRFSKEAVKLGFIQGRQGITTGWGGGTLLLEKINEQTALDWLMSARFIPVKEAVQAGYINGIMENMNHEAIVKVLQPFLDKEEGVLKAYKEILNQKRRSAHVRERMEKEIENCSILWESPVHMEIVNNFLGK